MSEQERIGHDLEATLEARRELGPEHERELVQGFVDRLDKEIDRRVDERLAQRRSDRPSFHVRSDGRSLALAIVSIAVGAGTADGLPFAGQIVAWTAIVLVNLLYSLRRS